MATSAHRRRAARGDGTRNLIVGISGPSCSGKTSLARLLRGVLDGVDSTDDSGHTTVRIKAVVLHEDDFYKLSEEIPLVTTPVTHRRLQDWDCVDALDLPRLERTLRCFHAHGRLPSELTSKEALNDAVRARRGGDGEGEEELKALQQRLRRELIDEQQQQQEEESPDGKEAISLNFNVCILEGFLLYANPARSPTPASPPSQTLHNSVTTQLTPSLKLFLRSTLPQVRSRRQARRGCYAITTAAQCDFWLDPPDYVDEVVWPNFVRDHGWLFVGGHVEAGPVLAGVGVEADQAGQDDSRIHVSPGCGRAGLGELLVWALAILRREMLPSRP